MASPDASISTHYASLPRTAKDKLAQEFAEVFPDAVQRSGETLPGSEDEILQVDVHPALITTIAATQELAAEVRALRVRLEGLEVENRRLRGADGAAN